MANSFVERIKEFRSELPKDYYFSVKDLIDFIIREKLSDQEASSYIKDWQELTRADLKFHEKWIKLTNMKNIAAYEKEEIAMLDKLLKI
jgi:hypothetical protein